MGDRVRIGTCSGPADAAVVRAMLSAHGIESVVGGEHHANLLGGLGGALIALDITVAAEDADEAVALLHEFREGESEVPPEDGEAPADEMGAEDSGPDLSFERRKRTGVAILLAFCITFGTAHMYTRAWGRGILFAALEITGFIWLASGHAYGAVLFVGSILGDAIGAIWRVRAAATTNLPVARARNTS